MRGLLVRHLRARRHVAVLSDPRRGGAVPDGENGVVSGGLQRGLHDKLVDAIAFQAVELGEECRRFDAGSPYHQLSGNGLSVRELHTGRGDGGHPGAGPHANADLLEQLCGRCGHVLGQRAQHARTGLDQVEADVALGIDAIQAVGHQGTRGVVQLGGQLHTRCTGPNDGYL